MPTIFAALWSRPSTSYAQVTRTVDLSFDELKEAMTLAVKRMGEAWMKLPEVEH